MGIPDPFGTQRGSFFSHGRIQADLEFGTVIGGSLLPGRKRNERPAFAVKQVPLPIEQFDMQVASGSAVRKRSAVDGSSDDGRAIGSNYFGIDDTPGAGRTGTGTRDRGKQREGKAQDQPRFFHDKEVEVHFSG